MMRLGADHPAAKHPRRRRLPGKTKDAVMKLITRSAALALVLAWAATSGAPARAQGASDLINPQISYAYLPPKSTKYLPMMERLKSFQLLEQFSQLLSPLRLPHKFALSTKECGFVNAMFYVNPNADPAWRIDICYEFVEAIERIAPKQGEQSDFTYEEVVVGSIAGVLMHEAGHAVFNFFDVPVFGREEDAADEMSTFMALQFSPDVSLMVVRGFAYMAKVWFAFGAPLWSDEHGTGLQRYYNTLCLAYGADPARFKALLDASNMPKDRAAGCAGEYEQIKAAFAKTVYPFIDQDMMKKVQAKSWLKLTPQQVAALRQQQQKETQTFNLAACNLSTVTNVSVALAVRQVSDPSKWEVYGWFPIPDGGCNYIGPFYGGNFYWYAFGDKNAEWSADDSDKTATKQCINATAAFDEAAGAVCATGQQAVNFLRRDIDPSSNGVTLRLTGAN
jgi:hypothetical protein